MINFLKRKIDKKKNNTRMSLTKEQRRTKLLKCKTLEDFHNLYLIVFKEEVPETTILNAMEEIDVIANAIYDNKKIKGITLQDDYNI